MKLFLLGGAILMPLCIYFLYMRKPGIPVPKIQTVEDIMNLYPKSVAELETSIVEVKKEADQALESIYAIEPHARTFTNTIAAYDRICDRVGILQGLGQVISMVSTEEDMREAGQKTYVELSSFIVDKFFLNPRLYKACEEYETRLKDPAFASQEALSPGQQYFMKEAMHEFRRGGLQLPQEKQEQIKKIHKELSDCETQFDKNIADDVRTLAVTKQELKGWEDSFIESLKKNAEGKYLVPLTTPIYFKILEECEVSATRKAYLTLFLQRGYPRNEKVLAKVIELRDQLGQMLGYPSYAHLDLDNQMAKSPENAMKFLEEVMPGAAQKAAQEVALLKKDLPKGVELTKEGRFNQWDYTFVKNYYKKKYLNVDEAAIAEYFPIEHTLQALLSIYEKFFDINFKKLEQHAPWHENTQLLAVYKHGNYIGTVILDLFPRPFKFTHAVEATVVHGVRSSYDKQFYPSLIPLICNFTPAEPGQPALLKRRDVTTFFHEFGHAIHGLLGITEMAMHSGTRVKTDFAEMPSQMLEEWLWDPTILKMVSSHYKTKEPLPDDLIEKIHSLKTFETGHFLERQLHLAVSSLEYFMQGAYKDIDGIWQKNQKRFMPYIAPDSEGKGFAGFGHLTIYGPKYYGYMWSLVYALDLFDKIKAHGLLDPVIGAEYESKVLSKGGSQDPMELITNFLGRKPSSAAFFKDLGIQQQKSAKAA